MIKAKEFMMQYVSSKNQLVVDELTIKPGKCVVVCGKSGCGKTSFLRLLNGLIPAYYPAMVTGELICQDFLVGQASVEEMSYRIASVFQNPATQFFNRMVLDELVFPCENQGVPVNEIEERLEKVTQYFHLENLLKKDLLVASGGERQKVAFATAMMQSPKLLLLDEPTANLDQAGIAMIKEQIQVLKTLGVTIIVAEHRLNFLADCADEYLYIEDGYFTNSWSQAEFLALTNHERKGLGLRQSTVPGLTDLVRSSKGNGEFEVVNLQVGYQQTCLTTVKKMSFHKGAISGIIGANGVGKTTLMHHLAGLTDSLAGEYYFDGKRSNKAERLKRTAFVLQETRLQLFADSVGKELTLGVKNLALYDQVVTKFKLAPLLERHPMTLSGGEHQRVVIANAILADKEIMMLDEPTSGLDYQQMMEVVEVLTLVKELGKMIIIVSHDEEFLSQVCDAIYQLK